MLKKAILVIAICFLFICSARRRNRTMAPARFAYPELFRDHVHHTLTDKGKEQFYAVNIHPDCKAKNGYCIPRAKCTGREMLYISRVCYHWDLVCCYDNSIRFPEKAWDGYTPPTSGNVTTEGYTEPPLLP